MARPKYLLPLAVLDEATDLAKLGVPMTKIHAQLPVKWSYQSTVDLLNADLAGKTGATRPEWLLDDQKRPLKAEKDGLIRQPPNWRFRGYFPDGDWVKIG